MGSGEQPAKLPQSEYECIDLHSYTVENGAWGRWGAVGWRERGEIDRKRINTGKCLKKQRKENTGEKKRARQMTWEGKQCIPIRS